MAAATRVEVGVEAGMGLGTVVRVGKWVEVDRGVAVGTEVGLGTGVRVADVLHAAAESKRTARKPTKARSFAATAPLQ